MKAISIETFGGSEVLKFVEMPIPSYKKTEILVKVHACGLNPVDTKIRCGHLKEIFPVSFPRILGGDISGTVVAVGSDVNDFVVGDEVYFSNPLDKDGGYAEFCVVDPQVVALKPKLISHIEAATLPVSGLTSIQALRDYGGIKAGQKILIHAGAGGVGSFAIQYAKHVGASVFTTTSLRNESYVRELGADVIINYQKEDFVSVCQKVGGMDMVLESIGGENYLRSVLAAREGGVVASIVDSPASEVKKIASKKGIKTDFFLLSCLRSDLDQIKQLIETQKIRPIATQVISYDRIISSHIQLESGKTRGKLVLQWPQI